MVKAISKLKLKVTMALIFFCKEVHCKCLKNAKRKSKKQDDLDTKKNRKRDTEANVLVFSLNAKLSSFYGLFFNCFHFMNLLVMVTGIIRRTLYKAMQHLIPTENSFLLFSTNHNVKQCAFYFFHALAFSAPWSRDSQLVSFPPSIVLFVCLCSDKNS